MTENNDKFDKVIEYKIKPDKKKSASRAEKDLADFLNNGLSVPNARNLDESFDEGFTMD